MLANMSLYFFFGACRQNSSECREWTLARSPQLRSDGGDLVVLVFSASLAGAWLRALCVLHDHMWMPCCVFDLKLGASKCKQTAVSNQFTSVLLTN